MAKYCSYCGNKTDDNQKYCLRCGKEIDKPIDKSTNCEKKKNNKMPIPVLILVILIFSFLFISIIGSIMGAKQKANEMSVENDKNAMLNDAETMLLSAVLQKDGKTKCLYIYGYDSSYKNSGNYRGSIDISGEEEYIWLSDGNYLVKGTYDNLTIIESNLEATTNCRY